MTFRITFDGETYGGKTWEDVGSFVTLTHRPRDTYEFKVEREPARCPYCAALPTEECQAFSVEPCGRNPYPSLQGRA